MSAYVVLGTSPAEETTAVVGPCSTIADIGVSAEWG